MWFLVLAATIFGPAEPEAEPAVERVVVYPPCSTPSHELPRYGRRLGSEGDGGVRFR